MKTTSVYTATLCPFVRFFLLR